MISPDLIKVHKTAESDSGKAIFSTNFNASHKYPSTQGPNPGRTKNSIELNPRNDRLHCDSALSMWLVVVPRCKQEDHVRIFAAVVLLVPSSITQP